MTEAAVSRPPAADQGIVSPEEWAQLAHHTITLPSGARVKVRIPDLTLLIAQDAVPEKLRGVALREVLAAMGALTAKPDASEEAAEAAAPLFDAEKIRTLAELHFFLVSEMLVEPKLTPEQAATGGLPNEDLELLVQIATRERDTDARGVVLGVLPLSRFERFRHHHGCGEGCEACAAFRQEFSTRRVGGV